MEQITVYLESSWTRKGGNYEAKATLLVEGVHAGSHGPIFHPAHVLRDNAHKWEGIAVTVDHPKQDGDFVSVNSSRQIWERYVVGRVTSPHFDEAKKGIRAILRVPADHPRAQEVMKAKGEVSVGIFSDSTEIYGQHGGAEYSLCAITHEPNHLAILSDGIGACSIKAGCGLETNAENLTEAVGQAIGAWIEGVLNKGRKTVENHESEAVYPLEVLEAEFLEKQKKVKEQEEQGQGHVEEANYPPEVM